MHFQLMRKLPIAMRRKLACAVVAAAALTASWAMAQPAPSSETARTASQAGAASPAKAAREPRSLPNRVPARAKAYYESLWGVDNFLVRRTASSSLVRFSYRVVDPARAAALNDGHFKPELIAPTRGVSLQVPSMEQIGDLRQKGKLEAGKVYWMAFSNKGNVVRPGDRVNVVIGSFRADGLVVQ